MRLHSAIKPTQANETPGKNLKIINKEIFPYFDIPNGGKSTNFAVDMERMAHTHRNDNINHLFLKNKAT